MWQLVSSPKQTLATKKGMSQKQCLDDCRTSNGGFWNLDDYKVSVFKP